MDTRRKISVDLELYKSIQGIARKEKHTLAGMLRVFVEIWKDIKPKMDDVEKRITRLEKATSKSA